VDILNSDGDWSMTNCDFYNNSTGGLRFGSGSGAGQTLTFSDCKFYSNTGYGIQVSTVHDTTFTAYNFNDCEFYSNGTDGIFIGKGVTSGTWTMNRCKIYSNTSDGFIQNNLTYGATFNFNSCLFYENTHYNQCVRKTTTMNTINCTLADAGAAYANVWVDQDTGDTMSWKNCIVYGAKYGFDEDTAGDPDPSVTYSDVYGASTANYFNMADPTGSNGNISQDPKFTDAAGDDYDIGGGSSPCINTGTSTGAPATDIENVSWLNANPEMGCYTELAAAAGETPQVIICKWEF